MKRSKSSNVWDVLMMYTELWNRKFRTFGGMSVRSRVTSIKIMRTFQPNERSSGWWWNIFTVEGLHVRVTMQIGFARRWSPYPTPLSPTQSEYSPSTHWLTPLLLTNGLMLQNGECCRAEGNGGPLRTSIRCLYCPLPSPSASRHNSSLSPPGTHWREKVIMYCNGFSSSRTAVTVTVSVGTKDSSWGALHWPPAAQRPLSGNKKEWNRIQERKSGVAKREEDYTLLDSCQNKVNLISLLPSSLGYKGQPIDDVTFKTSHIVLLE